MRGAARAFAWELGWHHRLGIIVLAAWLALFAVIRIWVIPDARLRFDPPNELAALIIVPVTIAFFYFVAVFTFGLEGDLAARESTYPARMLRLPVKTFALAGFPMLYGVAASMTLWFIGRLFMQWAGGASVRFPWVWPAFLVAAWLAWMQALTWLPYGLRGLRALAAIAWLVAVDAIVMYAIYWRASEATMIAMLAPQLPLAYLLACYAVSRARCGEVPDWSLSRDQPAARTSREAFRRASHAQGWLEWRRHGWTLAALVACVVPFELLLLFIPGNDTPGIVFAVLFLVLVTPPIMAALAAPAFASFGTFAATRPLTTVALVAAKLRVAMLSTVFAWMVVVAISIVALVMSSTMPVLVEEMQGLFGYTGLPHGIALVALLLTALVASTWKNLVQSLCIGLTGRLWLIRTSALVVFALLVALVPLIYVFARSEALLFFVWDNLPWILAALVCAKLLAAAWVAVRLHEDRVLSDRALIVGAAAWLAAVVALYAFLEWFAATPIFPFYFLAAIAILAIPLTRVSAAPLALSWSRHR